MKTTTLVYSASLLVTFVSCTPYEMQHPNILLILADDAGYADFGFNGSTDIVTPNLDRLAARSTVFSDAHVMGSGSSPSRAMLLTGRYGHRFGYECNPDLPEQGLPKEEITMAQVLQKAGYRTSCFGKWHLGASDFQHPNQKGFDEFWGFLGGSRSFYYHLEFKSNILLHYQHNGTPQKFDGYLTDELTNRAVNFIRQNTNEPFFMYLSYNDVHTPIEPDQKYIDMQDNSKLNGKRKLYAAKITALDTGVGEVMNALEETGQMDNTIVIFLSDNGGAVPNFSSNLPLKGFKGTKFEGGHRVPMFMSIPGVNDDLRKFSGITSSMDIFATLMDLLEIPTNQLPNPLDGVSLLPYLNGEKQGNPHNQLFWRKNRTKAIRYQDYQLICMNEVDTALYNLKTDMIECKNIKTDSVELFNQMLNQLNLWEKNCCIAPKWTENAYIERVENHQKQLLKNQIFTANDVRNKQNTKS